MSIIGPKAFIHLDRLRSNLKSIQKKVGDRQLLCVIKADGYGHGAVSIANSISHYNNIQFAVFSIEEALELRKSKIHNDIMVFSKIQPESIDHAYNNDLILNLSSLEDIDIIKSYAKDTKNYPRYHIKFDTGMTRLGVDIADAEELYEKINQELKVNPEGIYTHFATADEGDLTYAKMQLSKFKEVVDLAERNNIKFKYVHCSNSGAILNLEKSYFNMIRVGMLLYGAFPSNEVPIDIDLKPVMSFCGSIVNVRRVLKGTQVSYGGVYTTIYDTYIGVIQTGFADGFPRPWYEKGIVSYKGEEYKIAGRVCMDQLMVDFGETIPKVGDDVLFFGKNKSDHIPVEIIAESIKSTPYVLLTAIGGRTKYIYRD
tara:strand:- start:2666 stop:3778 length:1113 start_codon:yes stop_codon:yes gene_type:complete